MRIRRKRVYKRVAKKKEVGLLERWFGTRRNLLVFSWALLLILLFASGGYLLRNHLQKKIQIRFDQALELYDKGDYEKALKGFKGVASSFGGGRLSSLSLLYMGNIHYTKGDYREAIGVYRGLLSRGGDLKVLALYNMAKAFEALGELKEAEESLERAYKDPEGEDLKDLIALELASISERRGERKKAVALYRALEERAIDPLTKEFFAQLRAGVR